MQSDGSTRIPLRGRGGVVIAHALVDDQDAPRVNAHRWCRSRVGNHVYAVMSLPGRVHPTILLHRFVMGESPGPGYVVDHINRDGLDDRRRNLRWATIGQNLQNRRGANKQSLSGIRGVGRIGQKWIARAKLNGRDYRIGMFETMADAQAAVSAWRRSHMTHSEADT